jgi:RimJ/RimL family protein N-acetyltransferase
MSRFLRCRDALRGSVENEEKEGDGMSEKVYLRALEKTDLERMYRWHNDRHLFAMLGGTFRFVSRHAEQTWLENTAGYAARASGDIKLAICSRDSDKHVGNIYLLQIDWIVRHARMEVFIGDEEERSKGYGQSAVRQMLSYAFMELGLKRVYLGVLTDNPKALHVYQKIGFKIEGTLRNQVFKEGRWKDVIALGICVEDLVAGQVDGKSSI